MTDNPTLSFYDQHTDAYIKQTRQVDMNELYDSFISYLTDHQKMPQHILDVGCGSGRDSSWFSNRLGANVTAIDGSSELIKRNRAYYVTSNIDWQHLRFQDIKNQGWQNKFTGIWACASLLHLPFNELPKTIVDLIDTLASGGVMYASFKHGDSERWEGDRFFCDMNKERFIKALQLINFNSYLDYKTWVSADRQGGREVEWFNVLLIKRGK